MFLVIKSNIMRVVYLCFVILCLYKDGCLLYACACCEKRWSEAVGQISFCSHSVTNGNHK